MTAANTQIVTMFEDLGMSPEEIAESLEGYELSAIKAVLVQCSSVYNSLHNNAEEDITDLEFAEINQAYKNIALYSDNDAVRERALRNLRDEKRGRLPSQIKKSDIKSLKLNVTVINQHIKASREAIAKVKAREQQVCVDV